MSRSELREPGTLVQIRKGVTGQGDIGMVLGPAVAYYVNTSVTLLAVLFSEGTRQVHPSNLQAPDGRTRRRP
jgi:hypothetical protein